MVLEHKITISIIDSYQSKSNPRRDMLLQKLEEENVNRGLNSCPDPQAREKVKLN